MSKNESTSLTVAAFAAAVSVGAAIGTVGALAESNRAAVDKVGDKVIERKAVAETRLALQGNPVSQVAQKGICDKRGAKCEADAEASVGTVRTEIADAFADSCNDALVLVNRHINNCYEVTSYSIVASAPITAHKYIACAEEVAECYNSVAQN